jgi:DNA-binding MarR family transcriptional regulator
MTKILSEPTLDILFDSPVRTRILKLFLYNPEENFETKIISKKLNLKSHQTNKHLNDLVALKFLIRKNISDKKTFRANQGFEFYDELKELVAKASPASKEKMLNRLKSLGKIKLALLAGIFINSDTSRADILVVGDNIKTAKFNNFIKNLEAEVGKEINHALMTTKEFYYRHDMYDRFIRDLLDFKHEKLINKLKI